MFSQIIFYLCIQTPLSIPKIKDIETDHIFIVDTASTISIFPSYIKPYETSVHNIPTCGKATLNLTFGQTFPINWTFSLAPTSIAILGLDFLQHFNFTIDFNKNLLFHHDSKEFIQFH